MCSFTGLHSWLSDVAVIWGILLRRCCYSRLMMCPEVVAYYPVSAFIPHLALTAITCRTPQCQQHGFSIQHQCLPLEPLAQMSSDWPSLSVFKSPTTDGWQEMAVSARLPEAKGPRRPGAGTVLYCVSSTSFQVIHTHPHAPYLPAAQNRSSPVFITTARAGAIVAHWQLRHTGSLAGAKDLSLMLICAFCLHVYLFAVMWSS